MSTGTRLLIYSALIAWHIFNCESIVDDVRVAIQTCDGGSTCPDWGSEQYTPYAKDGGGWTAWTGDNGHHDPDGARIGLFGRDHGSYFNNFIEDIDMRLCVQITDHASNSDDNSTHEGTVQCTPWISAGGGWSRYATSRYGDWGAWRVQLDVKSSPGLLIDKVRSGVQVTDDGTNTNHQGAASYTRYLEAAVPSTWCAYASHSDWYDPDAVRVYLSATSWTRRPTANPSAASTNGGYMAAKELLPVDDETYGGSPTSGIPQETRDLLILVILVLTVVNTAVICVDCWWKCTENGKLIFEIFS